jgi:hypothetical protein
MSLGKSLEQVPCLFVSYWKLETFLVANGSEV